MAHRPNRPSDFDTISLPTLHKAVESTISPLIVTDAQQADNPIVYCNQAFVSLSGYSLSEILGRNCRFLQGKDTDKQAIQQLRDAIANQQHVRVTIKNYRKDGSTFWNDLVVSPVFDDDGTLTNFIGMQLDITERVSFEERLTRSQRELEHSNKELEQFTYAASHDLQEPLRMVSSYLQLIQERYKDKLDEDGETFIGFATDGAQRMQALVNDLLTLSRVRTSARRFKTEDLSEIIQDVLDNLQAAIKESGAQVTYDQLPKAKVDRSQIMQLLQNLISNAIKYREAGRAPQIHISASRQDGNYVISVKDNGIGIEPRYHERIFGVFQRLHTRAEYPGTGVGLAICSKIVERHGGQLTLESTPGQGAIFTFTLPMQQTGNMEQ
jgi:chemotaxis family two-component system sensor kinase Cph1